MHTNFPYVTAAAAVALAVLQMFLMLYTANGRGKYKTGLGDGGHDGLLRRMRMHGNLAENAPLFLILLGLVELSGEWHMFVFPFAVAFVIARSFHPLGLAISSGASFFRLIGVLVTFFSILGLAVLLAITLSRNLAWLPSLPGMH